VVVVTVDAGELVETTGEVVTVDGRKSTVGEDVQLAVSTVSNVRSTPM